MADRRMLSATIAEDEPLNRMSIEAQLLFLMTIPHLDRDGLISGNPRVLFGRVCPLRDEFRDRMLSFINEWVDHGLVVRYESNGPVLFFQSFRKHQRGMEYHHDKASRFAPPPGWVRTKEGLVPEDPFRAMTLAESFDGRSAYRRALEAAGQGDVEAADGLQRPDGKDVATLSRQRSNSDPAMSRTDRKINRKIMTDDDDGQSDIPPTLGYGEGEGCKGGAAGGGVELDALQGFNLALIECVFGETTWDGAPGYVEGLTYDDQLRLAGWLWKCVARPSWSVDIGVGFIRSMMAKGAAAGLVAVERQQMVEALEAYSVDPGEVLFGGGVVVLAAKHKGSAESYEIDY